MGHLVFFRGTDNLPAVRAVKETYRYTSGLVGASVPATEHSVMCAGGKESELETFRRLLDIYPEGIVSIVSDTWDFWGVLTGLAVELKDEILARQPDSLGLAKVVFRPDSGDPVKIICGDPDAAVGSPEHKGAVRCLDEVFGHTVNDLGFKVLNPRVGLIYGDSITLERCDEILQRLTDAGYASGCVVFGVGSFTYQYKTRDSLGFAVKSTHVTINGVDTPIFKDPKTDSGTKKSAKGLLRVDRKEDGEFVLTDGVARDEEKGGELKIVFQNGELSSLEEDFEVVRKRASS
jgi:nicotinamide phosphoribosyltransferase